MTRKEFLAASAAMAVAVLFAVSAQSADQASIEAAFAKVRAVADGICTVTDVSLRLKSDPKGKDPLEMWRSEVKENDFIKSLLPIPLSQRYCASLAERNFSRTRNRKLQRTCVSMDTRSSRNGNNVRRARLRRHWKVSGKQKKQKNQKRKKNLKQNTISAIV